MLKVVGLVVAWRCQAEYILCLTASSFRLLMIGGVSPETCWASYKYGIINFDTLLHLVGIFLYELNLNSNYVIVLTWESGNNINSEKPLLDSSCLSVGLSFSPYVLGCLPMVGFSWSLLLRTYTNICWKTAILFKIKNQKSVHFTRRPTMRLDC